LSWEPGCRDANCQVTTDFNSAISAAAKADVTIYMMALDQGLESEGHDRADIALPLNQYKLLKQIRAATNGKPVIVLLVHGGTLALADVMTTDSDAVLDAWYVSVLPFVPRRAASYSLLHCNHNWGSHVCRCRCRYPGMLGGHAIADVIFGKHSPAGRAPVTYYKDNVELPAPGTMDFYPATNGSSKGLTYRFYTYANLSSTINSISNDDDDGCDSCDTVVLQPFLSVLVYHTPISVIPISASTPHPLMVVILLKLKWMSPST
jgi:beta-D-xylosidase 4